MPKLTIEGVTHIISNVEFLGLKFALFPETGGFYLQVCGLERDPVDGEMKQWTGRKWRLSAYMTKSEVVQTCFKAIMTWLEHEARENFTYRKQAIFGPHFDVEELVTLAQRGKRDVREDV